MFGKISLESFLEDIEGRFKILTEICMFKPSSYDIVDIKGVPEFVFEYEFRMRYVNLYFVSTMATEMQERLNCQEFTEPLKMVSPNLPKKYIDAIIYLLKEHYCICASQLSIQEWEK